MFLQVGKKGLCFLLALALVPALFIGCAKKAERPKPAPPHVTSAKVVQQDVPIYIDAIGQAIAPVTINIRPQVAGKLMKAYIQQGALVQEGEVLYEIDPRPYQAILDESIAQLAHDQALLEYAEKTVARYKQVVDDEFIAKLSYEQFVSNATAARAQVDLDKASIAAAQLNIDFCKVTAPVSGKISFFNVDVGNILATDDTNQITVLRPFTPIDILFSLPQQQFELIRHEQGNAGEWKFIATLPESPKELFTGTTYFIDNQVDQTTGTVLLKGRLSNEARKLWPGEFVRVKVLYKIAKEALKVPPSAVLMGKDGPYIYTVDHEEKAVIQKITVLTRTEEYIAIQAAEVHAGDTVIVDGQLNVAPGLLVVRAAKHL